MDSKDTAAAEAVTKVNEEEAVAEANHETNEDEKIKQQEDEEEEAGAENNGSDANLSASRPPVEGASPGKIFVGGLPKDTTADAFRQHFEKYGEIVDSVIMKHRSTGHPRGFGFITYKDPAAVDAVILDNHVFDTKTVEIKRTIPKGAISGKDFKTKKIFVGGIPTSVNEDEFKNFFVNFGEIEEHQIMRDHTSGCFRGFGFIAFSTEKAVDDLLTKGNRIDFAGAQVEIKKAEPKKPGNAPAAIPSTQHYNNPRPGFGRGFRDHYSGGIDSGPYRYGGGVGSRARGYGGYGGSVFDGGYEGYGGTGMGAYGGESSLGFSGCYGGALDRSYGLGAYGVSTDTHGRYAGAAGFGSGYDSGAAVGGYGGSSAGLYGGRRDYGGGPSGRHHPYAR